MTGDAFLTEPVGEARRAGQASTQPPLLDQDFDSGTLYALRAAVQARAGQAGLSEERASEVVLAVHELAANAIAHGAGHGRLRVWDLPGALRCEVLDGGPAGAGGPSEAADAWPAADGHGLWLVRQVADRLDLWSGPRGTRATVTFARALPEDRCRTDQEQEPARQGPLNARPLTAGARTPIPPAIRTGEAGR